MQRGHITAMFIGGVICIFAGIIMAILGGVLSTSCFSFRCENRSYDRMKIAGPIVVVIGMMLIVVSSILYKRQRLAAAGHVVTTQQGTRVVAVAGYQGSGPAGGVQPGTFHQPGPYPGVFQPGAPGQPGFQQQTYGVGPATVYTTGINQQQFQSPYPYPGPGPTPGAPPYMPPSTAPYNTTQNMPYPPPQQDSYPQKGDAMTNPPSYHDATQPPPGSQ